MELKRSILAGLLASVVGAVGVAGATGLFPGFPFVGGASYCNSLTNGVCSSTVPAGPGVFVGTENVPFDTNAPGSALQSAPSTVSVTLPQLGQGPMVDQTTVGTSQTIPNNTPWFFLDGAQGSAFTVTFPPNPVEGQIQRIICEAATVGTMTATANTTVVTQVVKLPVAAACVAGVGYVWRYQASNLTWYRVQ